MKSVGRIAQEARAAAEEGMGMAGRSGRIGSAVWAIFNCVGGRAGAETPALLFLRAPVTAQVSKCGTDPFTFREFSNSRD